MIFKRSKNISYHGHFVYHLINCPFSFHYHYCKIPVLGVVSTLGTSNRLYIQPSVCLLLFVDRFRYIDIGVIKDGCSIPTETTVRLGPLGLSLRAAVDHHGPSIHSGHYTASINCCKKAFYCGDRTITEFGIVDSRDSSAAYVVLYELIDT